MFFRKKESDSSFDDFIKRAKKFSPFELEKYDEYADFLRENKSQAVRRRLGLRLVAVATPTEMTFFCGRGCPPF